MPGETNRSGVPSGIVLQGCFGLFVLLILCFLVSLLFSFTTIGPTETAVATRFGEIQGTRNNGVHYSPFMSFTKYDLKTQSVVTKQAAATADLQDIDVEITVNYTLQGDKVLDIYKATGDQEALEEKIINPITAQVLKSTSTKYEGTELIQKRQEVTDEVKVELAKRLEPYHVNVQEISLTNFVFTNPDFNAAIDRKQIAEQDALKAKFELDKTKIQAEQQRVQTETLTKEILTKMWIEKWNGVLPTTLAADDETVIMLPAK